jgi:AraC-like DNA-binding protein
MAGDASERTLFRNEHVLVGELWCPPESERWREVNEFSPGVHVVFPRTAVLIHQLGREPVLADRNLVLFYNPGQRFLRFLHDPDGDHCYFVAIAPEAFAEVAAREWEPLPFAFGPRDAGTFLLQHAVVTELRRPRPDPLAVEEGLVQALARACDQAWALHGRRSRTTRAATRATHRRVVEEAKSLLADRLGERLTLDDVASALNVSKYHLARVFRATTGFALHGYRHQLRLRVAVERLEDDEVSLAAIAAELGFFSNSHLTDSFRRAFGVTPSAVRGRVRRRGLRHETRRRRQPRLVGSQAEGRQSNPPIRLTPPP